MHDSLNEIYDLIGELTDRIEMLKPRKEAWSFKDVADFVGCSELTVKRNYQKWGLPFKKLGHSVLFKPLTWESLNAETYDPQALLKKKYARSLK